ncbi:MAG: outer membrane beta-barrel family protein [Prevotellaceae bacterium]|jgi:hypothetical protein|nr:outer membrane beta-barrel family protein [Prevotellaceae bacterium]
MKKILVLSVFIFSEIFCNAQTIISGRVAEYGSDKPLENVAVVYKQTESGIVLSYSITDIKGNFAVKIESTETKILLTFALLGYEEKTLQIDNKNQTINISLITEPINIKELKVQAEKVRQHNDTVEYIVSSFADVQDKTIGDVLKKMPGIEVHKNGQISYNGKSINTFYIEGKDLLENKYGLATNNVSHKDVASIEVLENHQPVQALKDIQFSDRAAINLKLKENAKLKWVGKVKADAGFLPFLWSGDIFAMRFTKKSQNMHAFKTNNMGFDIGKEINVIYINPSSPFFGLENFENMDNLIQTRSIPLPPINDERSVFNNSYMITTNTLWGVGKNKKADLKLNTSYLHDSQTSENLNTRIYLNGDTAFAINEHNNALDKKNKLDLELTLKSNTEKHYLLNSLKANAIWNKENINTFGTIDNNENDKLTTYKITNDFKMVKRIGNKAIMLASFVNYKYKPKRFDVNMALESQKQKENLSSLYTNNYFAFTSRIKRIRFDLSGGIKASLMHLNTKLTGVSDTIGQLINNINTSYIDIYFRPRFSYNIKRLHFELTTYIDYYHYHINDNYKRKKTQKDLLLFTPNLYANIELSALWSLSASAGLPNNIDNTDRIYSGYILRNYQTLERGLDNIGKQNGFTYNFMLNYKNPIKLFFAYLSVSNSSLSVNNQSSRDFIGNYIIQSTTDAFGKNNNFSIDLNFSKSVDALKTNVSLNVSYSSMKSEILQNNNLFLFDNQMINISPKMRIRFAKWCNFEYIANFQTNKLKIDDVKNSSVNNFNQTFTLVINPAKKLNIKLNAEHYRNEITTDKIQTLLFGDITLSYFIKENLELGFNATNIFNKKKYSYTIYNDVTQYTYEYIIRPRNISFSIFFSF